MLPCYVGEDSPRQNSIDFESGRKSLIEVDEKMVEIRRFERINTLLESKSAVHAWSAKPASMRNEELAGNVEIFVYGLKDIKTKVVDNYIITGCGSEELNGNYKLYNFWSGLINYKEDRLK